MSFIDIKDATKRDKIVADYVATIRKIQQRNEDEKSAGLAKKVELELELEPIVKATEKSTEEITKQLQNLIPHPKTKKQTWDEKSEERAIDYYLDDKANLDIYFGIEEEDGTFVMGDTNIKVFTNSDLSVNNEVYKGTPGLWRLIMTKNPKDFTHDDLEAYKDLIIKTGAKNSPHRGNGRPTTTNKWKLLQRIIPEKEGKGIFLPGDMKGLTNKLNLLLAEFRAGNTSTRNEIVFILDELLRRKRMSRKEYTEINSFLQ